MADTIKILLDKDITIADVGRRLYSTFVEHLGRCVYGGIYEPGHPTSDASGFRDDVRALVRELHVGAIRYPGGNFVSGYNWLDGIGPREKRPRRLDYAWSSIETNEIGMDEFCDYAKSVGSEVMYAVNLGTGTPQDAGYAVEYANFPGGTYYSDLRIKNGHTEPHNIKLWCLGNEMDGPWQTCPLSAADYGKKALEAAKIIKWVDPSIEVTLGGSSGSGMPTFPEWDRVVLEQAYDHVDYLSLHRYYEPQGTGTDDTRDFLAGFYEMDGFIKTVAATADYVKALKRSKKTMLLSFDEWNIWYTDKAGAALPPPWSVAPRRLENTYSLLDALAFGGLLCTLINNSDRVRIACLAQMVNVIAPIFTEKGGKAIRQTTFYPFSLAAKYCTGTALKPLAKIPLVESAAYGMVPSIACAATYDAERNEAAVICVNIADTAQDIDFDMRSFGAVRWVEHVTMQGALDAANTFAAPETVKPAAVAVPRDSTGTPRVSLPPKSFHLLRFTYFTY